MKRLGVLIILAIVLACSASSNEDEHEYKCRGVVPQLVSRYFAWRRPGGRRSACTGTFSNFVGRNLYGSDSGCCGNYAGCCKFAAVYCYLHDASFSPCCGGGPWLCGPYCKKEPSCNGR